MLGLMYKHGSIVAILARFAFKFEIQVPQPKIGPRELKLSGSSCLMQRTFGSILGKIFLFVLLLSRKTTVTGPIPYN